MMATTAIWDVKDNLKRVLDYTTNPEKTENNSDSDYQYNGLRQVLTYTTQDLKTEKQLYVSGINCSYQTALEDMRITKQAFNKIDGILAYHGYQAFAPGEVNAELAHQIGIELANELWGDRFEVLVSTHLDKAHYHNHFVINSVSFKDGLRYQDNKATYRKMREVSDDLCHKYHLSVIENPQGHALHYSEYLANKNNIPTIRSAIKEDVDYAISKSMTMKQFFSNLENMGYTLKHGRHLAVQPPGKDKFIRLRSLSKDNQYTEEAIKDRILEHSSIFYESVQPVVTIKKYKYVGQFKQAKKLTGFKALYFSYMYRMGILPKGAPRNKRVYFLFREDLRYMDQISEEATLLAKRNINNIDELEFYEEKTSKQLNQLIKERRCVYNKINRCRDPEKKEKLEIDLESYSNEIKELRKEVRQYASIKSRSITMKDKIQEVQQLEKESESHERRGRNSRPNGKNEFAGN